MHTQSHTVTHSHTHTHTHTHTPHNTTHTHTHTHTPHTHTHHTTHTQSPDLVVDGHTVSGIPGNQRWGLVQVPVCVHNVLHVAPFVVADLSLVTQTYPCKTGHWGTARNWSAITYN